MLGFVLLLASEVRALTLADLIAGDNLMTSNGLTFDSFDAVISGDLATAITPADLEIVVLSDGFRIAGPISAADGEIGDILLSYSVTQTFFPNLLPIIGASLLSNGVAEGIGAQAGIDELLLMTPHGVVIAVLSAFDTGAISGDAIFFDEASFDPIHALHVEKDILVDSVLLDGGVGGSARISLIDQRFQVVPEPTSISLMSLGLAGLAFGGRRRRV